jgi:superfamily I DNA/RNA helicase
MMIKSLVSAVAEGGSFTFFGDVAQQIYGGRLSWRDSGINTDKIWKFDVNYRNPEAITIFAKDITQGKYWQQDNDMIEATPQIAKGPKPILVAFSNRLHEMDWIANRAISVGRTSSAVIVCRSRADIDAFLSILKRKGCYATEINKNTPGYANIKTVYLTTYHSVKGLEFDNVFIPLLSEDKLPDPDTVAHAVSEKDVYADEAKLLYVAATRSKYGLFMSYSGALSPLFPKNSDNYVLYDEADVV